MQCPFCQKEGEPVEKIGASTVEVRCPHCKALVAAYQKGMEGILKNLVSLERFERGAK
ncbi:MAG: hypothetical protein Q8O16_05385 [Dehalococcoidia bacterium]|nr:hypothetical protein [Dehalococcoidia bacterium]